MIFLIYELIALYIIACHAKKYKVLVIVVFVFVVFVVFVFVAVVSRLNRP